MRPLTYGSPVTPRNTANISRPSEELLPVRFRWVKPAASLKRLESIFSRNFLGASFRWVKPAASLKQNHLKNLFLSHLLLFPLGKTGGLIEACLVSEGSSF